LTKVNDLYHNVNLPIHITLIFICPIKHYQGLYQIFDGMEFI